MSITIPGYEEHPASKPADPPTPPSTSPPADPPASPPPLPPVPALIPREYLVRVAERSLLILEEETEDAPTVLYLRGTADALVSAVESHDQYVSGEGALPASGLRTVAGIRARLELLKRRTAT